MTDEKREYTLKDGITKVRRSGLTLNAGQTLEAYPDILHDHGDVLKPVDVDDQEEDQEGGDDE